MARGTAAVVVVAVLVFLFFSEEHRLEWWEKSQARGMQQLPFILKRTKQNCVDRLIVIYIPLG